MTQLTLFSLCVINGAEKGIVLRLGWPQKGSQKGR
jgi:hypothetical protein